MKRLGQFVFMIAIALMAADPVLADMHQPMHCGSMDGCHSRTSCCGDRTARETMPGQAANLDQPSFPCQPQTCLSPVPQNLALVAQAIPFDSCSTSAAGVPLGETSPHILLHRPPYPVASPPALYLLLHVFRI